MTRDDHELNKFTSQSQVKITGIAANKIVNTYDVSQNLTLSREYKATRETTKIDITQGIINSSSFRIYGQDGASFYIWFNIDSTGIDPSESGTGIEITIVGSNTPSQKVNSIVTQINNTVAINTKIRAKAIDTYTFNLSALQYGVCNQSVDIDSGLSITRRQEGKDFYLVAETQLTYDVNNNATEIVRIEH
jgi:hypothetical protein